MLYMHMHMHHVHWPCEGMLRVRPGICRTFPRVCHVFCCSVVDLVLVVLFEL